MQMQAEEACRAFYAKADIAKLEIKRDTETLRRPRGSDNMELLQFGVEPRLARKRRSNTKSVNLSACARSLFERFLCSFALL